MNDFVNADLKARALLYNDDYDDVDVDVDAVTDDVKQKRIGK